MKKQKIVVGVDIGGTNTAIGALDFQNNYLPGVSFATMPEEGIDKFLEKLTDEINRTYYNYSDDFSIEGIGLAVPTANYLTGIVEDSANLKWKNVNLIDLMKKHFDLPVTVINDANAAALGEQLLGAANGMKNFIVITLGTGLGSGIVVDGKLVHGQNGLAGELGHMIVIPDGRMCNCGRYGCLETYISANGLRRTVLEILSRSNDESELRNISFKTLTSKYVSELAQKQDPIALQAFDFTGKILGQALANIVTYFDPEAIILYGGLAEAGDLLLQPTNHYFEDHLLSIYRGKVKIMKSKLQGGAAAVLGACGYVLNEIKKVQVDCV